MRIGDPEVFVERSTAALINVETLHPDILDLESSLSTYKVTLTQAQVSSVVRDMERAEYLLKEMTEKAHIIRNLAEQHGL